MKPKVLIVDDSASVRADLRQVLGDAEFLPLVCGSIEEARREISEEQPDLIILDVLLEDGDGVELLKRLRAEERTAHIPILVLSTQVMVEARLRGLRGGATDYVGKPYDPAYVVKRARELTQARPMEPEPEPTLLAAGHRRRVLVVDDGMTFRQAVVEHLRKDGHDLIAVESAEQALALLEAQPADCILMDLVLPGMDGIEASRLMRANPQLAHVPLLMFTSCFDTQKLSEALAAGVDAFCPKAGDLALLCAQVRNLLRRRAMELQASIPLSAYTQSRPGAGAVSLFDHVVALSGLSPVIASSTVARACRRANVAPEYLDGRMLIQALPFLREALRVFLVEHEARRRMAAIEELTRVGQPWAAASGQ